jgi:hypothetical protein
VLEQAKNTQLTSSAIQQWMQQMLLTDDSVYGHTTTSDVVNDSTRLSAQQHLDIYKSSYIARLREVMRTQFSALAYALGNDLFEAFADQFLEANPSTSYTLSNLGQRFASFLAATRPDVDQEVKETWPDFMIALAEFEFSLSVLFDVRADERYTLATENTPDDQLALIPVFHLFQHNYPVCRYYLDLKQGKEPELPYPNESYSAAARVNYQLGLFELRPAQYHFLLLMQQLGSVHTAKNALAVAFNTDTAEVDRAWREWRRYFIASRFFMVRQ